MKRNSADKETYLECLKCEDRHLLEERFKIYYDSHTNPLRCALYHPICKINNCIKDNFSFIKCDFCGRGTLNNYW
jgi:hypothetical protein